MQARAFRRCRVSIELKNDRTEVQIDINYNAEGLKDLSAAQSKLENHQILIKVIGKKMLWFGIISSSTLLFYYTPPKNGQLNRK